MSALGCYTPETPEQLEIPASDSPEKKNIFLVIQKQGFQTALAFSGTGPISVGVQGHIRSSPPNIRYSGGTNLETQGQAAPGSRG